MASDADKASGLGFEGDQQTRDLRIQTKKAREIFEETCKSYNAKFFRLSTEIDEQLIVLKELTSEHEIAESKYTLDEKLETFSTLSEEFLNYLIRQKTAESEQEALSHKYIVTRIRHNIDRVLNPQKLISITSRGAGETPSIRSSSHRSSNHSSSILAQQAAKVEASKIKLEYVAREAKLIQEKAELEAKSVIQKAKKEAEH